jgi:hypothetical protein
MMLDFVGGIVTLVMSIGLLLFLLGLYPSKLREDSLNLLKHGLFSIAATAVSLVSVVVVMIPVFLTIVRAASLGSISQFPATWLHAVLGSLSMSLAILMIALWVKKPVSELGCAKAWKLMKPTFAVWATTTALGVIIYVYGLT